MSEPSNPYSAPAETSELQMGESAVVRYAGGKRTVVAIGVAGGLGVTATILGMDVIIATFAGPFVATGFIWLVAAIAMMFVMRGSTMHFGWKIFYGCLFGPLASVIYMPVCMTTAVFLDEVVESTASTGFIYISAISVVLFVLMMLGLAAIVRRLCQHHENKKARIW